MSNGDWSDLPGGATARPYVKSLTVVNAGQSAPVFSGGVGAASGVQNGDVTAVVMPFNLCRTGQAPAPGQCYATPNRVGITLGYKTAMGLGRDFSRPSVALRQTVTESTVFDVVIGLNTLGRTLRWTWANGELVDWKTTGLGTAAAEIRLRIKPSVTPDIDWGRHPSGGCTATPIRDCDLARADGRLLGSELVLSLDETLSPALTGAVCDGLLVTIDNVTFSAPTYRVARKAAPVRVRSAVRGRTTTLSTAALAACRNRACTVTVYRTAGALAARAAKVASGRTDARGAAVVQVGAGKLARRSSYIVAVRRGGRLVTSAQGVVR